MTSPIAKSYCIWSRKHLDNQYLTPTLFTRKETFQAQMSSSIKDGLLKRLTCKVKHTEVRQIHFSFLIHCR